MIMKKSRITYSLSYHFSQTNVWQELGYLSLLIMDSLWLGLAYYLLANPVSSYWIVITIIGSGIFISFYLGRFLNHRSVQISHHRAIYLGWLCLYLLLCHWGLNSLHFWINPSPGMLLFGMDTFGDVQLVHFFRLLIPILVIYRGLYIARNHLDPVFFQGNFKLGLVAVGILGLYYNGSPVVWLASTFAFFLIIGLIGSTISRIYNLNDQRGGKIPPPGWSRSVEFIRAVLLIVFAGIFIGWLVGYPLGGVSQRIMISVISIVFILIGILLSPILLASLVLFEQLAKLLPSQIALPSALETGNELLNDYLNRIDATIPGTSNFFDIVIVTILGVILLATVLLIMFRLRWQNRSSIFKVDEDNHSIGIKEDGHKKKHRNGWLDNLFFARNIRRRYYANRIRAIYASFLSLCAVIGVPRNPALTPNEFLYEVVPVFTGCGNEVKFLTSSYNRIRYGELPETEEECKSVESAWQVIKTHGIKMKKDKGKKK